MNGVGLFIFSDRYSDRWFNRKAVETIFYVLGYLSGVNVKNSFYIINYKHNNVKSCIFILPGVVKVEMEKNPLNGRRIIFLGRDITHSKGKRIWIW